MEDADKYYAGSHRINADVADDDDDDDDADDDDDDDDDDTTTTTHTTPPTTTTAKTTTTVMIMHCFFRAGTCARPLHQMATTILPSASTSLIISSRSFVDGFCPRDFITVANSFVVIVPSPSLSNSAKASLNSAAKNTSTW